jgi:hypothetical protein
VLTGALNNDNSMRYDAAAADAARALTLAPAEVYSDVVGS